VTVTGDPASLSGTPSWEEPEGADGLARMTLGEHLAELRRRLIISIAAIAVGAVIAWFMYNPVLNFLIAPYRHFLALHPHKNITHGQLVINGPLEGFTTRVKIATYIGIGLASPVVLWELWRFITPGLHKNEKRYAVPFVCSAVALFSGGVATAILVFPKAISWLISVSGSSVTPIFTASQYFSLYVLACLIFGCVFLYPIVLMFLMISGAVPSRRWRKWRRMAIVIIAATAAIITPSNDPFSFLAMAVPMYVFYEGSIILGRILKK
jgi:sec-independent protein translocase protein TatC